MTEKQKKQILDYFTCFVENCNEFDRRNNSDLREYWSGQVFGMCKIVDELELDIDTSYYLKKLP